MKKAYIQIPEPCHENWNKMTPVDQGRYCSSCCKEVTDFSLMTDQEIINYLSKPSGNTCGRFAVDQLNRTICLPATPAKKRFWGLMLSILVTLAASCKQRVDDIAGKSSTNEWKEQLREEYVTTGIMLATVDEEQVLLPILKKPLQQEPAMLVGDSEIGKIETLECKISPITPVERFITGTITDSGYQPIPFATIKMYGSSKIWMADSNGIYCLPIIHENDISIQVSSAGYKAQEVYVPLTENTNTDSIRRDIILKPTYKTLDDVVVLSYGVQGQTRFRVGGYSFKLIRVDTPITRLADTIQRFQSGYKLFPNPAAKGSIVQIEIKLVSDFDLLLVDNNGRSILRDQFSLSSKREAHKFQLPSTIATGLYYVKVMDKRSKKQYTSKLIIK